MMRANLFSRHTASLVRWALCGFVALLATGRNAGPEALAATAEQRFLYVATPGIRNYLEYGGHGLLVYNIDQGHRFVRRIPSAGFDGTGKPLNVKGICASAPLKRVYVSTLKTLIAFDLTSDKIVWEREYEGGCDRMAISPDGQTIYLPSLEKDHWHVVDAASGDVLRKLSPRSGAHNTLYSLDGTRAYLAGLKSPWLHVADTRHHSLIHPVGPFGASIRPFTINGSGTLCFVNVNGLLGFEVGDLRSGAKLYRVEVAGYSLGPTKRHGCPSHGIGMTPDETEIWLTDAPNSHLHVFDAKVMPPKHVESIPLRDQPGWITFGIDGRYAYPSTGEVIETATRKIVAHLKDEQDREIQSEKMLQIDFRDGIPVRVGNQFGTGRRSSP